MLTAGQSNPDLGSYPLGNHEFTDLLHSRPFRDFVATLARDAQDIKEARIRLGALAHYAADIWGHPAVNAGVAIEYPKLRQRYGSSVTTRTTRGPSEDRIQL
jgi:hypothetical protein